MENIKWDKFLDNAVSNIRDQKIKEEVREELLDHLEDRKERFMRFGDSEDEAEKKSLETMGDCVKLKNQLGEIHTRCYVSDLNAALSKIFWGFALSLININFFGFQLSIIGALLIFAGTFQLRNCNPTLKRAYRWILVSSFFKIFICVCKATPFYSLLSEDWNMAITSVSVILSVIQTVTIFAGIESLCLKSVEGTDKKVTGMAGAIFVYILSQIFAFIAVVSEIPELVYLLFLPYIYVLYALNRERKTIVSSEYRTETVDEFGKKGYSALGVLAGVLVVSIATSCVSVAMFPIKTEVYVHETTEKANDMRRELIEKGFPEEVAEFLPDEEIEKCFPIKKNGRIYASSEQKPITNGPRFYVVAVPLEKEHRVEMRYIQAFKYLDSKDIHGYRDSVITGDDFYPAVNSESYGVFYKENGVLYREEPRTLFKSSFGTLNGMDFRTVKGADEMYGYFAVTGMPSEKFGLKASYTTQIHLWNYPYFSAADILKDGASPYDRQTKLLGRSACRRFTWEIGAPYYDFMFPDGEKDNLSVEEIFIENESLRDKYCKVAFSENGIDNEEHFEVNLKNSLIPK